MVSLLKVQVHPYVRAAGKGQGCKPRKRSRGRPRNWEEVYDRGKFGVPDPTDGAMCTAPFPLGYLEVPGGHLQGHLRLRPPILKTVDTDRHRGEGAL